MPSPTAPVRAAREDRVDRRLDEVVGHPDLEAHLLGELHLDRRAAVGLDALGLSAVPLHAVERQAAHLRPEEGLEDVVQLLGPDNRDDELQEAPPPGANRARRAGPPRRRDASGSTRIAPSPLVYASSPCCVTSRPRPSSRAVARSRARSRHELQESRRSRPRCRRSRPAPPRPGWRAAARCRRGRRPRRPFHDFCAKHAGQQRPDGPADAVRRDDVERVVQPRAGAPEQRVSSSGRPRPLRARRRTSD